MENIIKEIKSKIGNSYEIDLNDDGNSFVIKNIPNKMRKEIHSFCENNNLYSDSKQGISVNKDMIVSKQKITKEIDMADFNKIFAESFKYPIEIVDPHTFSYYIQVIKPFFPDIEQNHIEMIETCKKNFESNAGKMKTQMHEIKNKIISEIQKKESFINFQKFDVRTLKSLPNSVTKNIFISENINKTFIRFDIIKAFFTVINNHDPNIFDTNNWNEFIQKYTDLKVYSKSKILREIIGGELTVTKKALKFAESYIATIYEKFLNFNPVCVCGDAIIFDASIVGDGDEIFKFIEETWPNSFRKEKFVLKGINTKTGWKFYEEHEPNIDCPNKHIKIKCCEKKYFMQIAKFIQKLEILDLDKKFFDNGMKATFDESIFY